MYQVEEREPGSDDKKDELEYSDIEKALSTERQTLNKTIL